MTIMSDLRGADMIVAGQDHMTSLASKSVSVSLLLA